MPIHSAFTSRHKLDHPDEHDPPVIVPTTFERVMKYNPNHAKDGKFTSGPGGRHGTEGPPTHGAFGQTLRVPKGSYSSSQSRMDGGFNRGPSTAVHDPKFHKGPTTQTRDPNFHHGEGDAEMAGSTPYKHALGGRPYNAGTGGYKAPAPHGPYDIVKAGPDASTNYKLVPHNPKNDPPQTRGSSEWVLDLGKSIPFNKSGTWGKKEINALKDKATEMAKGVKSWEEAHTKANEAEFENYHEVAAIFRARAKHLKH